MQRLVLAIAAAAAALILGGCSTIETAPARERLRVISYNIHHGEGLDGKLDLERIAKLITEAGADLVALQEVDRGAARTKGLDIPAELGRLTGMTAVFRKNFDLKPGEYGNAILSKLPVKAVANTWLPLISANEQRGFLQVTVRVGKRRLMFASTHLDYRGNVEEDRLAGVAKIREILAEEREKTDWQIVAGDFNARPDSQTYATMTADFKDAWALVGKGEGFTIPVKQPRARIDYVWARGSVTPVRAEVLQSEASDHLPLLVEVDLGR